jgi:hypothetical protein
MTHDGRRSVDKRSPWFAPLARNVNFQGFISFTQNLIIKDIEKMSHDLSKPDKPDDVLIGQVEEEIVNLKHEKNNLLLYKALKKITHSITGINN